MPQKMLDDLPKEVIFEILQYLNFKDLNHVSVASKYLHSLATDPSLWRNFDFRRKCRTRNMEVPISSILALPRFQKLKRFSAPHSSTFLEDMKEWGFSALVSIKQIADLERTEFNKIMENLQNMSLQEFVLGRIPPGADEELLLAVLSKSKKVILFKNLPETLVRKFVESIPRSSLKSLHVTQYSELNIKTINPKSLAVAINRLEEFRCDLESNFFTEEQKIAFQREMFFNTKLKVLKLSSNLWTEIMDEYTLICFNR